MATKYYLNQAGLESFLDNMANKESNVEPSDNVVVIAKPGVYSSQSKELSSIELNTFISQQVSQDGAVTFVLTDSINNINKTYYFRGNVANLSLVSNPVVNDVYKNEESGFYAVWSGNAWNEFGIIDNFSSSLIKADLQAIPTTALNDVLYNYKPITVISMEELIEAINKDQSDIIINVDADLTFSSIVNIPAKKEITINFDGHSVTASNMAFSIDNSRVTLLNGSIESSANDAISVDNRGVIVIDNTNVTSVRRNGISAKNGSTVVMNGGSVTSQEAGIAGFKDSTIIVNDGTITGLDNGPLMGNGSPAGSANDGTNTTIIMNGGTLIAHIQSSGYIACGVYVPNSGSFTMNGGSIITDGCGVCMRGGQVNLNGGEIIVNDLGQSGTKGKVGDSRVVVGPYAVVYDAQSRYPAMDSLELNIAEGMVLNGLDGDIDYILEDGVEANVNDNR